jgi:hypothetical protein
VRKNHRGAVNIDFEEGENGGEGDQRSEEHNDKIRAAEEEKKRLMGKVNGGRKDEQGPLYVHPPNQ